MPFDTNIKDPNKAKLAALAEARKRASAVSSNPAAITRWIPASEARERARLVFDDSYSMGSEIEHAKQGVIEFNRNCIPNQTAVAIHFLNTENEELATLNTNLIEVSEKLEKLRLSSGGTPLFETMNNALIAEPDLTRLVVFTDGEPTDDIAPYNPSEEFKHKDSCDKIIERAKLMRAPIDTVFFGYEDKRAMALLRYLSDQTGGYFLHFDPAKVNFAKAFRYLAGPQRLMLASESVRREIESGRRS
jgi:hypothetical protein